MTRSEKIRHFGDQSYDKLKTLCVNQQQLFVDTLFPPTNESLFLEEGRSSDIVWKRPAQIYNNPHLFVEGAAPNDVTQGILGNCWFVSACSALTHNEKLLAQVIPNPDEQEWAREKPYAGIFRFRFWRFGTWVEVVIDDLLPTSRDGKLLFARSKTPNEFWSALLEKAFAKLYGCYENLVGGHLSDALQDVSGGVAQTLNVTKFLKDVQDPNDIVLKLFNNLKTAFDDGALIVAAIAARTKEEIEESLDCGLVKGHAYAVTAICTIDVMNPNESAITSFILGSKRKQNLIRLQNPWGEREWNGAWSDDSSEWENVSESQIIAMGVKRTTTVNDDGEFWMPWESFVNYFTDISLCQLFNTSALSVSKSYNEQVVFSEWTTNGRKSGAPDDRAGGCLNFPATFCNNPQYIFDVPSPNCSVIFALTQNDPSEGLKEREPFVTIGMHVMKVENNRQHRLHQAIHPVATSDYTSGRSVYMHLQGLPCARYLLVPTTYAPREHALFMLRIYSDHNINFLPLITHAPKLGLLKCKAAQSVTRLTIHGVDFNSTSTGDHKVYAILKDSSKSFRTKSLSGDTSIRWDEQFLFHKSKDRQQYKLEIWEDRDQARDHLMAQCLIVALIQNENREMTLDLTDPRGTSIGSLLITVAAFDDPMYL